MLLKFTSFSYNVFSFYPTFKNLDMHRMMMKSLTSELFNEKYITAINSTIPSGKSRIFAVETIVRLIFQRYVFQNTDLMNRVFSALVKR